MAWIKAVDSANSSSSATNTDEHIEVLSLLGLSVTSLINYGDSMYPGDRNDPLNNTSTITVTGNCSLDINLSGTNMTAGLYSIPVVQQRFSTSISPYASGTQLLVSQQELELNLEKTVTSSLPYNDDVFWGIEIPLPQGSGNYTGANTFMGKTNEVPW
jgi:hypothetical protein